ncbi:hypothetical protein [Polycladidibacter stylochi]|uniref:hypothetical protein n=1 Tax=Polycladidibacter stylochi TaxID=1807766 RepID=UPI000829F30A|nr:hypothetical protein [Pseudovibrio stylochi]
MASQTGGQGKSTRLYQALAKRKAVILAAGQKAQAVQGGRSRFDRRDKLPSSHSRKAEPATGADPVQPMGKGGGVSDTSSLNSQIVQAVQFTNSETMSNENLAAMVNVPADVMASQTAGHANQNAEVYMNGIMQISMAAQAMVAKKIAANPAEAAVDAPALLALQEMVTAAIGAFGTASETGATSAQTIISDVKIS